LFTPSRENLQKPHTARFAILGGSFNPVHLGHVAFARALAGLPEVAQVLAIPAARNPLKADSALLPDELRWQMARSALGSLPKVSVLDMELLRGPPSYSIETAHALQTAYPWAALDVALGWDAYRDLARWRGVDDLLELAGLIVVPRSGTLDGSGESRQALEYLPPAWARRLEPARPGAWCDRRGRTVLRFLSVQLPPVSGTRILAEHAWDQVPDAARALLLRHLGAASP